MCKIYTENIYLLKGFELKETRALSLPLKLFSAFLRNLAASVHIDCVAN